MLTIEDVEEATVLYSLGIISKDAMFDINLAYAKQPENPILTRAKNRLKGKGKGKTFIFITTPGGEMR